MLKALGHLGLWAGLYALAAFICFSQLAGLTRAGLLPQWEAMACVLLTATAVYSIDRVKMFSAWLDPADIEAQPERYKFLSRQPVRVRSFAVALLIAAAIAGARIHSFLPILVVIAAASTVVYAPKPRRRFARVKDRLWLKNAYVAIGMTAFSALIAIAAAYPGTLEQMAQSAWTERAAILTSFITVTLRILFDAALCDIDDEPTDRRFRTETFATSLGTLRVWNWAGIGRIAIAAGLFLARPLPFVTRVSWSIAMILGMIALRWRHPTRIRDTVDFRFLPEAVFVTVILFFWKRSS
ncbi:MAG: hypothetical protein KF691_08695 [Phycisphaeraceae bacterium]|nr:hypothetical protein [Phycisphaeraceae bacterium]